MEDVVDTNIYYNSNYCNNRCIMEDIYSLPILLQYQINHNYNLWVVYYYFYYKFNIIDRNIIELLVNYIQAQAVAYYLIALSLFSLFAVQD